MQFSKMLMISDSERSPKKVSVLAVFLNIGKGKTSPVGRVSQKALRTNFMQTNRHDNRSVRKDG